MFPYHRRFLVLLLTFVLTAVLACQGASEVHTGTTSGCIQGSGHRKSEVRELPSFQRLEIEGAFSVSLVCGQEQTVSLTADDNLLPLILTEVTSGTLRITTRQSVCTSQPMTVTLSAQAIDQIKANGANTISATGVAGPSLSVNLAGAGTLSASGSIGELAAALDGASKLLARELRAEQVRVSISGAGSAEVHTEQALHAEITGVGEVRYAGRPAQVVRSITGWGEVIPLED